MSTELSEMIALAVFIVYLQFAIVDTLEELSNDRLLEDLSLHRFHIPRSPIENELAPALATVWLIQGTTPTYFILRSKLWQQLNEIAAISDRVKFGTYRSRVTMFEPHQFLSLRYEFVLKNTIDAINNISNNHHRRWCICLDELEIVPEGLRRLFYRNLRSSDQRVLFKISLSPFSIDLLAELNDSNNPMPAHDFTEIYLSYPRSSDAMRFGRELVNSLLQETDLADVSANAIFGSSDVHRPGVAFNDLRRQPPLGDWYPATTDPSIQAPLRAWKPSGARPRVPSPADS